MTDRVLAASLAFGVLIVAAHSASADPQCGARAAILGQLADTWGETRRSIGIAANNMVVETFASPATQSWTIVVTTPEGKTCLIATGEDYENMSDPLPARGDPA